MELAKNVQEQMLDAIVRYGDMPIAELRRVASTDALSKRDIMAEVGSLTRGQLIRLVIENDYFYEDLE